LAGWRGRGEPSMRKQACGMIEDLLRAHDYRLPEREQQAIDEILARAHASVAPGATTPGRV
ncbi:MAG: hypothetical protein AAB368_03625, partial [bacterium]